jgi:hypothetical protein
MREYRLYCVDGIGKFTQVHDLAAANDAAALLQARAMKLSGKCELWEHGRIVAVLDPHSAR